MIVSCDNKQVKRIAKLLKSAKYRREEGVFVVEGIRAFLEVPVERI